MIKISQNKEVFFKMKVIKGSHRLVLIFDNYVIKLLRIDMIVKTLTGICRISKKKKTQKNKLKVAKICLRDLKFVLKGGVVENLTEYQIWKMTRAKFLARIVFGSCLVIIQIKCKGKPISDDSEKQLKKMKSAIGKDVIRINPHCWDTDNFLEESNRIVMVDYGDDPIPGCLSLRELIARHRDKFEEFLLHK